MFYIMIGTVIMFVIFVKFSCKLSLNFRLFWLLQ